MIWYLVEYKTCKRNHVKAPSNLDIRGKCKLCVRYRQQSGRYKARAKAKYKEDSKDPLFREKTRQSSSKSRAKKLTLTPSYREVLRERTRLISKRMDRSYIAHLLKIKSSEITDDLYELKCLSLLLVRNERKAHELYDPKNNRSTT